MKIREGFVTNSSSSSFIIAKHKDCTKEMIYDMLSAKRGELVKFLKENSDYIDDLSEELEAAIEDDEDEKVGELLIKQLTDELFNFEYEDSELKLPDWTVYGGSCSNETDVLIDLFLYESSYLLEDTDYFKIA